MTGFLEMGPKYGPQREKTSLPGFAKNTGADQPAHPRSLISTFVICYLVSIICRHDYVQFQFSS